MVKAIKLPFSDGIFIIVEFFFELSFFNVAFKSDALNEAMLSSNACTLVASKFNLETDLVSLKDSSFFQDGFCAKTENIDKIIAIEKT